jgi:hypothetical protein
MMLRKRRLFRAFLRKHKITIFFVVVVLSFAFIAFQNEIGNQFYANGNYNEISQIPHIDEKPTTVGNGGLSQPEEVDDKAFVLRNLENNVPKVTVKVMDIASEEDHLQNEFRPEVVHENMGKLDVHTWESVCSFTINSMRQFPLFPHRPKTRKKLTITHEVISKLNGAWLAQRIMGYLHPPASGGYQFELSSFFMAELWLSKSEYPKEAELISKITRNKFYDVFFSIGNNKPKSNTIYLLGNATYYFEILHVLNDAKTKEDHVRLSWKMPDFDDFTSITSSHVSAFIDDNHSENSTRFLVGLSRSLEITTEDDLQNETAHGIDMKIFQSIITKQINTTRYNRENIRMLEYIDRKDFMKAFLEAPYAPSYTRKRQYTRYQGVYSTHFTDVFPNDETKLLKEGYKDPTERDGNILIDVKEVFTIVKMFMEHLEKKFPK